MNDFLEEGALEEHVLRYKSREGVPGEGERLCSGLAPADKCSPGQVPLAAVILGAGPLPLLGSQSEGNQASKKQFPGYQIPFQSAETD